MKCPKCEGTDVVIILEDGFQECNDCNHRWKSK